ncbi:MAG: hemerythrin domain-containing protein [Candidatus Saliniplasma sp.]
MLEHDEILKSLEVLEEISERIEEGLSEDDKVRLKEAAHHLIEAEKHHKREEDTLFPRLRGKGITGPPRIMEIDHEDL